MVFCGIGKFFSTYDDGQYEAIGQFWDVMAERWGRENLRGLGHQWTKEGFEYVIGLKNGGLAEPFGAYEYRQVSLPVEGWQVFDGQTRELAALYEEVYTRGPLLYEIETFREDGTCRVWVIYK